MEVKDHYAAKCSEGVWDTGINPNLNACLREILMKNRKNACFFIEVQQGMSFDAARKIHRIKSEKINLKRSYRNTQIGLWIAAGSLLVALWIAAAAFWQI